MKLWPGLAGLPERLVQKVALGISSSLALVGIGFGIWAARMPQVDRQVQVIGGRSTVSFFPSVLESNGLKLTVNATADSDSATGEQSVGFAIANPTLELLLDDGRFVSYEGGAVPHRGGFKLQGTMGAIDATSFSLVPLTTTRQSLALTVGKGKKAVAAFDLVSPRPMFDYEDQRFIVGQMDLQISEQGAAMLGRPDLAGLLVGTLSLYADTQPADGGGPVTPPGDDPPTAHVGSITYDVAISELEALVVLGRVGSYPNGRNGLSMRTTSCNVGDTDIPWRAPMQVDHPVIAMNLYRVVNGRFEQIGWSWLKHGFFATNQDECGVCNDSGGSFLGPDCSDTYGTGNNGDRFYLGERKEVNPYTGVWTCTGSWFSNYQPDCVRRNTGSGLDSVAHRLEVADADLGISGAEYYYEAFYINTNETVDVYNNISSRKAGFNWTGSTWSISVLDSAQTQGPAINRWGDLRSTSSVAGDGDVITAVKVTDNGNGTWHYEYALYNHNSDRAVREFSIPVPNGANITNVGFRDIDTNATNQWTHTVANGAITWSTGTEGSSTANPLRYSSVFNFRFDANVEPASSTATLGLFKSGAVMSMASSTRGPLVLAPAESFTNVMSVTLSGNLQSLKDSDDDRLTLRPGVLLTSTSFFGIEASITAPNVTINSILIGAESRDSVGEGSGGVRRISLFNWSSLLWEPVDTRPITNADSKIQVTVSTNAGRFVNASTRQVLARFENRGGISLTLNRPFSYDQVGFKFN